jgi:pentapeptide MXKDX repeat protein
MKNLLTAMAWGVLLIAGAAFADDMSKDAKAKHDQMMRDCIAKQDSSMTRDVAMKTCEDMLRKQMEKEKMDKMEKQPMPK